MPRRQALTQHLRRPKSLRQGIKSWRLGVSEYRHTAKGVHVTHRRDRAVGDADRQIAISNTVPLTKVDANEIKAVLSEYRMNSAAVTIHQPDATIEDIIDVVEGNR